MAVRDILILPDKRLRLKSEPVKAVDKPLRKLVDDMFETMYAAPGIGLAAIQIGVPQRVVTMDLAKKDDPQAPQVFINPEVTWKADEKSTYEEGCLSIPEYYEEVERPAAVRVKYLDLDGKPHEIEADRPARHLSAARDRPHQRRPVHRLHLQAQARHGDEAIQEGGEEAASRPSRCPRTKSLRIISANAHDRRCDLDKMVRMPHAPDLHGHARFRGADAHRARGSRARDRGGLYARGQARRRAAWSLQPTPVEREARRLGLPVLTPKTLKDEAAQAAFRAHKADAAVVVAYGLILPKPILDAPRLGCFNVHASLLPRWRGAAPINRAIMAGDAESGVTIMQMDEGLDTGAMAMAERMAIGADMTAGDLHDALARLGADLMLRALAAAERGSLDAHAAAGAGRHLRRQDRQGRDPHRLDEAVAARCTTTSAACRRFPAPGSSSAACASRRCARPRGEGKRRARHGARRSSDHRLRRRRGAAHASAARRQAADERGGIPARHRRSKPGARLHDGRYQAA